MSRDRWEYNEGGVYVFRTRRPGFIGKIPYFLFPAILAFLCLVAHAVGYPWWVGLFGIVLSPRHTAYVGESSRVRSRKLDHLRGSVKFNQAPKPWTDLKPSHYFIPVPGFKALLLSVETVAIALLWPVYNHQKNLWNPRRIPIRAALRQRGSRDFTGGLWSFNFRIGHAILWAAFLLWQRDLLVDIWTGMGLS